MKDKRIQTITYSAMGIALILLVQSLSKIIPAIPVFSGVQLSQFVIGTFVNAILLIMCIEAGVKTSIYVGILSAFFATLIGIGPIFPIITPFIAVSNVIYIVVFYWMYLRQSVWLSSIPAAIMKTAFLWITIPIVLTWIPEMKAPQAQVLTLMFSWPQLVTGILGGLVASSVASRIRKNEVK